MNPTLQKIQDAAINVRHHINGMVQTQCKSYEEGLRVLVNIKMLELTLTNQVESSSGGIKSQTLLIIHALRLYESELVKALLIKFPCEQYGTTESSAGPTSSAPHSTSTGVPPTSSAPNDNEPISGAV